MLSKISPAILWVLIASAVNPTLVSASPLTTKCTLKMASGDEFIFPCELRFDPALNMAVITDLNSGKVYGKGWAEGRGCLYKEGYGEICTEGYKWILPNGKRI